MLRVFFVEEIFLSYLSLARKYRPSSFQELVGQDAVVQALSNAIKLGREPHSLLFSGVRGIGKTTLARLYAKALNCEKGPSATPCNICESCKAIVAGCHEDVCEIDGASNTSVDDIRLLQETLGYVPQRSKFRIFIIDEVHMLSQSAFNALLKTLEEPPAHVIFVFATTEINKVPATILSRCQSFHLQKISILQIIDRLKEILVEENVSFDDSALSIIAREGKGSMRDSLTFLDQAIALGGGQLSSKVLKTQISNVSSTSYLDLLEAYVDRSLERQIKIIEFWDKAGIKFREATEEVARFSRHAFIVKDLGTDALDLALLGLDGGEIDRLQEISKKANNLELNIIFKTLVECRSQLDGSTLDRFILENYSFELKMKLSHSGAGGQQPLRSNVVSSSPVEQPKAPPQRNSQNFSKPEKSKLDTSFLKNESKKSGERKLDISSFKKKIGADQKPSVASQPSGPSGNMPPLDGLQESGPASANRQPPAVSQPSGPSGNMPPLDGLQEFRPASANRQPPIVSQPSGGSSGDVQPQKSGFSDESHRSFPSSWRELVDNWKRKKPLQARIIEEAYLIEYNQQKIELAVGKASLAAGKLLQKDLQNKIVEQFKELFGFRGQLIVREKSESGSAHSSNGSTHSSGREIAKESLLDISKREKELQKQELLKKIEHHPVTKEAISAFNGSIESIQLGDS